MMNNNYSKALSVAVVTSLTVLTGCQSDNSSGVEKPKAVEKYVSGYQAYKKGNTDDAIRELEAAVARNPELRMARITLGEIYRTRNDYNSASKQYESLVNLDPYTLNNHYYLGVSYQFLTRYDDSAVAYLRGLKLSPEDFRSNMNLGAVYLGIGDVDSAVNYLDKATQIDPKSAVAWSNLGVALDAKGSMVLAETAYRKAIELDPSSLTVLQNLGSNLLAQSKNTEALTLWLQIVEKAKTSYSHTRLGEAYGLSKQYDKAAEQFAEALKLDPNSTDTLNVSAAALIKQYEDDGRVKDNLRNQALDQWKKSLQIKPTQPKIKELLEKWSKDTVFGK